jgi:prevent-host-death family protein
MELSISAADANRNFSAILRAVRDSGTSYVVTNHGKPVARLVPAARKEAMVATARDLLLQRLSGQPVAKAGHWTRDELYEDGA